MSTLSVDTIQGKTTAGTVAMPAGMCVQTVDFSYNTEVATNSTSYVHTGITVNLTPKFNNSKIYVNSFVHSYIYGNHDHGISFKVTRTLSGTETDVYTPYRSYEVYFYDGTAQTVGHYEMQRTPIFCVDTPNTTSECTYKIYYRSMRSDEGNGIEAQGDSNYSHGFIMEIKQ